MNTSLRGVAAPFLRLFGLALGVYGAAVAFGVLLCPLWFQPAEDAVILWMYSRNLALHGAITYVVNGPHTEGATDFAWMLALSAAIRCHLDPFWVSAVVNAAALLALSLVLARLADLRWKWRHFFLVAGAAGCLPQVFAAVSGFATLTDAVLLSALVLFCIRQRAAAAALTALLFCLFRPDGLVFAVPLLAFLLHRKPAAGKQVVLDFVLPGALYAWWRAAYFHELFPLPFLVKSDAHRTAGIFIAASMRSSLVYLAFTLVSVGVTWFYTRERFRGAQLVVATVLVPTCFYWCMRLDQNVGFRFFYFLPLSAALVLALNWKSLQEHHSKVAVAVTFAWVLLLLMPLRRELRTYQDLQAPDLRAIANELRTVPHSGPLLSSEAGILPYFSGWDAVDPWGLNTATFAHRFFQPSDVAPLQPSLIHTHPDRGEGCLRDTRWQTPYMQRSWPALTRNLIAGADTGTYDAFQTSYGSDFYRKRQHWEYGEGDVGCWFVRKGTAEHDEIVTILQRHHARTVTADHQDSAVKL